MHLSEVCPFRTYNTSKYVLRPSTWFYTTLLYTSLIVPVPFFFCHQYLSPSISFTPLPCHESKPLPNIYRLPPLSSYLNPNRLTLCRYSSYVSTRFKLSLLFDSTPVKNRPSQIYTNQLLYVKLFPPCKGLCIDLFFFLRNS